ncbi:MAG: FkbM family methyltransferase [Candidatus Pacebacteria bacterium]|nr:FkbM family methyltransferase [Candidatus Paceibacterota bacterium]
MNFSEKLKKRVDFIINKIWRKTPLVILYSLAPSTFFQKQNGRLWINNYLEKKGFVKNNNKNKIFELDNLKFFYSDHIPTGDIVSILLSRKPFIKTNFLNNPLTDFEQPYESTNVFLEENDIVIDAGANIGVFSIFASKQIGKNGHVFAFEPIKRTNQLLIKNIETNFIKNIQAIPYALGDTNINISFFVDKDKLVSSSSEIQNENAEIENVEQITLDSFLEKNTDINKIDFIKVDIEGAERKFLEGAKQTIQKYKPKIAICTYHLPDDPEVIEQKIRSYVPKYKIQNTKTKLFAWIEK